MAALNGLVIFSVFIFVIFILGFHNFLTSNEENGCEMTFMFEYPQFVRIALPLVVARNYSRYGLYAYGEGHHTERLRQMRFSGIPVLFIPGNSGSFKQVRSLASVSLRKTLNSHAPFHFDYFTVDLNEEYSALFGGVLDDQKDFVHHCIHRILQLYKNNVKKPLSVIIIGHSMIPVYSALFGGVLDDQKDFVHHCIDRILQLYKNNVGKPSSVIIIGQSMGGMVAKGLFTDPTFDKNLVKVIVTLVTPHKHPVLSLDSYTARFYGAVNEYWRRNRNIEGNLSHITFASIGGGHRDILVRSGLTQTSEADVSVVSTAIPDVWLSTDHLCSVWCKELVLVIVRTLFDIVNLNTKQVSENVPERNSVFQYHLLQRTAGKRFSLANHVREVYFDKTVWKEYLQRQFTFHEPYGIHIETHIMIRLIDDPKHEMLSVEAINVEDKDWVFACVADVIQNSVRMCNSGINLSNETQFLTSRLFKRKVVHLNLSALKNQSFTHVVLRVKPTKEMVTYKVDVHSSSSRHVTVSLPKWLSFMSKQVVIDSTSDHAGYYELALPGLEQAWQAYRLHIQPKGCQEVSHHAVATMKVPWSHEDVHTHVTENTQKPLHLKLQTPKPINYNSSGSVKVVLILDPACRYTVRIQSAVLDSLGQLTRFYSPMLLPYLVCILLLTMRYQLKTLMETGQCVMFHTALGAGAKPYYVLPVSKILAQILGWSVLLKLLHPLLPVPDLVSLREMNLDFFVLPFYLYFVAFAIAYILGLACWLAVIFSGHTAHKMALRFLARTLTGTLTISEWAMAGLSKLPVVVAAFLIALTNRTSGALSLCAGAAFFFLKLCKMYEEYLEELFKYSLKFLLGRRKKNPESTKQESTEEKEKEQSSMETNNTSTSAENLKMTKDNKIENEEQETENEDKCAQDQGNEISGTGNSTSPEATTDSGENSHDPAVVPASSSHEGDEGNVVSEQEESADRKRSSEYSFSELHFNFTALLLWLCVTLLNVPSVLVWAHNYKYNVKLEPDPSFETSFILCFCIGILWQGSFPKPKLRYYNWVMHSLYVLAILSVTYAQLSLHHLGPIVTAAFVIITIHQVVAGIFLSPVEESAPEDEDPTASIKTKLE